MMFFKHFAFLCMAVLSCSHAMADDRPLLESQTLPHSELWPLTEPLDVVMVRGINRYAERELVRARQARTATWLQSPADSTPGQMDRQAARDRLRSLLGVPAVLATSPVLARSGNDPSVSKRTLPWAEFPGSIVTTCQWDAFEGVTGRGLVAIPKSIPQDTRSPVPLVVVIPDADQSPEACFGLEPGAKDVLPFARELAEGGCVVLCPVLVNRDAEWSGHPDVRWTNMPHREFVYRSSFEMGLHPVGYELAKVLTGIQAVQHEFPGRRLPVTLVGTGEGGLIALVTGAVAGDAVAGVAVRGYFQERERVWTEPIYRNLFGQLQQFGDAEMASLIAPRPLLIVNCTMPTINSQTEIKGRASVAAPGRIESPAPASVQREFARALGYFRQVGAESALKLIDSHQTDKTGAEAAESELLKALLSLVSQVVPEFQPQPQPADSTGQQVLVTLEFLQQRMKSQVEELIRYSQRAMYGSQQVRKEIWKDVPQNSRGNEAQSLKKYRELVHETFIGRLPAASVPPHPHSRKILDEDTFTGYEILLNVHPPGEEQTTEAHDPGLIAGGILLLPKDLQPGEQRPVVVFQHGLEGVPMDTITHDPKLRVSGVYHSVSAELAKRGFIVYAPQNPYRGGDEFRVIQRKSNPLGRSLFSYIVEQHRVTLNWLADLSYVDASRIAFYGLSYGGKTAMRVPPLLVPTEQDAGYCLSICSADYNDWIRKNASTTERYSYVFTGEYEIFEWNMAHIANYAELSWLMIPRPFMVERGLDDGVAPDDWVGAEYARTRRPYLKLGLGERTEIDIFNGPHAIHGTETYSFLHRHLHWPVPEHQ